MMEYCEKCRKKTFTVHNDWMVSFCADCHTMRGDKSRYTGKKMPFECIHCGESSTELYVGQNVCLKCENERKQDERAGN